MNKPIIVIHFLIFLASTKLATCPLPLADQSQILSGINQNYFRRNSRCFHTT